MSGSDITENIQVAAESPAEAQQDVTLGVEKTDPAKKPHVAGISLAMAAAIAFTASVITSGAMLIGYDHFVAKKFVSVDIKGFVESQRDLFLAGKISEEQMRANWDKLETVVKGLPRNRVVVMGDAVIQGVEKVEIDGGPKDVVQKK